MLVSKNEWRAKERSSGIRCIKAGGESPSEDFTQNISMDLKCSEL
jgi:hypothetical protein